MAFVLSSISGNLISAASAGFAPTNSADVSAIASAYQVVSATATQLYAGSSYVTSVNDAPLSASRAGNAANASMANSAYYDGTGRLISALPDSAAVSAIASAYAESAASSKQDTLSFAYNTADQISSINGSALGGMDEAAVSGIASAYAESAVSSKADSSALSSYVPYSSLEYNTASAISGINGSALAAGSTYSAGEGIDITDDVISVETPVDIVAGPGIVIDNPDGNTLRVSTDENYETVLWSGTPAASVTCSESVSNFTRLRVYVKSPSFTTLHEVEFDVADSTVGYFFMANAQNGYGSQISATSTTVSTTGGRHVWFNDMSLGSESNSVYITKVVGVHRLSNN